MNDLNKRRKSSKRLAAILLGLGVAVFLWEISYKMSLYEPDLTFLSHISNANFILEGTRDQALEMAFEDVVNVKANRSMEWAEADVSVTSVLGFLLSCFSCNGEMQESGVSLHGAAWNCESGGSGWSARVIRFRPPPAFA